MKTFTFTYKGIYPVGACGIVNANTKEDAFILAQGAVAASNGAYNPNDITIENLREWRTDITGISIILNGNY